MSVCVGVLSSLIYSIDLEKPKAVSTNTNDEYSTFERNKESVFGKRTVNRSTAVYGSPRDQ